MFNLRKSTKAIAVRQPWAWLIINGYKDIENRSRNTSFRGKIFIHACKEMTRSDYLDARIYAENLSVKVPDFDSPELQKGGLIGTVDIVDCHEPDSNESSRWHQPECYGYQLENAEPCLFYPMRGQLGIYSVRPDEVQPSEQMFANPTREFI